MTLMRSGARAFRRARNKGLRVLLGFASLLLLDGCRTWDDGGGWHGHRPFHHHHHHRRQTPHHPPPAPLVAPSFRPPMQPPLPAQPSYLSPPRQHWHHQDGGQRNEHNRHGHRHEREHRKRR